MSNVMLTHGQIVGGFSFLSVLVQATYAIEFASNFDSFAGWSELMALSYHCFSDLTIGKGDNHHWKFNLI